MDYCNDCGCKKCIKQNECDYCPCEICGITTRDVKTYDCSARKEAENEAEWSG